MKRPLLNKIKLSLREIENCDPVELFRNYEKSCMILLLCTVLCGAFIQEEYIPIWVICIILSIVVPTIFYVLTQSSFQKNTNKNWLIIFDTLVQYNGEDKNYKELQNTLARLTEKDEHKSERAHIIISKWLEKEFNLISRSEPKLNLDEEVKRFISTSKSSNE